MNRPSLLLIYTGGTIGMMENAVTGALQPLDFSHMYDFVPELRRFAFDIDVHSFEEPIDSSNVNIRTWVHLAGIIQENYSKFDGFVVLHGTDTMAYTASALSFMLEGLSKPVIFTGAQLPMGRLRTDGRENLITALEIAAARFDGNPAVREVCIYFESSLFRGNRTHKYNTEDFDAFESANYPTLANVGVHIFYNRQSLLNLSEGQMNAHLAMSDEVALFRIFPGMNESIVRNMLLSPSLKGLVLETFGSGNAPMDRWFSDILSQIINRGVVVVNISQCNQGFVEQGRYQTSLQLVNAGVCSGADMTVEAALTKLMYLIGKEYTPTEIRRLIETPLRGELTNYSVLGQLRS